MVNLLAAAPSLVLFLGALILLAIPRRLDARIRLSIALTSILAAGIFIYLNASHSSDPIALLNAPPLTDNLEITFHYDGGALLFAYIVLIAAVARHLLENLRAETDVSAGALIAVAGALAFFCADNWSTVAAGWLVADLGLVMMPASGAVDAPTIAMKLRALAVSQVGALVFLVAGLLASNGGAPPRLDDAALDGVAATLLLLAVWLRCGFWPLHFSQASKRETTATFTGGTVSPLALRRGLFTFGVPTLMGISLLERALVVIQGGPEFVSALHALALFALVASALLAITRFYAQQDLTWSARAIAAPLLLLPFIQPITLQPALAIWLGLGFFNLVALTAGASILRAHTRREPWLQVLWGAGLLVACGFPFTPAFLGRVGFYATELQNGDSVLIVAVVGATALALIPLWKMFLSVRELEPRRPTLVEYVAIALLLLPMLAEGLVPFNVLGFFGRAVQDGGVPAYDALFHADNFLTPILLLIAVLLPLLRSFILARAWVPPSYQFRGVERVLDASLNLDALARGGARIVESLGVALRQVIYLLEQHPIGWLVFAAIWLALWILGMGGS